MEFNPHGIRLYNNYMYLCDGDKHIQVFDLGLSFIESIGSCGKGGELNLLVQSLYCKLYISPHTSVWNGHQ